MAKIHRPMIATQYYSIVANRRKRNTIQFSGYSGIAPVCKSYSGKLVNRDLKIRGYGFVGYP
jgi:hypothetical protein